jgi:hypothetical protein
MNKPIHYFQIADDRTLENPLRSKCMRSVYNLVREGIDTYEVYRIPSSEEVAETVYRSDQIRFERAANDPCLCYVDTDCFMVRAPELTKENIPYFPLYEFSHTPEPFPEPFLFYVNGNSRFFLDCLKNGLHNEKTYGFDLVMLRNMRDYGIIPSDSFVHCYISLSAIIERQKMASLVDTLELEVGAYREGIKQQAITMKLMDKIRGK